MNQSLIPPLTGAEIVNATLKAKYCVKWSTNSLQIVYCVHSIAQLGPTWAKQSAWLQRLIAYPVLYTSADILHTVLFGLL